MDVLRRTCESHEYLKGSARQWLSIGESICGPKQLSEIVQAYRNTGMIGTERLLVDRKRTPQGWLRLV
jgi:hypothetical protein